LGVIPSILPGLLCEDLDILNIGNDIDYYILVWLGMCTMDMDSSRAYDYRHLAEAEETGKHWQRGR